MSGVTLEDRCRLAFIQVAEADSVRRLGRPLTLDELRGVLARYPPADHRPRRPPPPPTRRAARKRA